MVPPPLNSRAKPSPSEMANFGVLSSKHTKMEWEPRGRRVRVVLLYRKLNRGGQLNETASVKDLLTEAVDVPPRLIFNRGG